MLNPHLHRYSDPLKRPPHAVRSGMAAGSDTLYTTLRVVSILAVLLAASLAVMVMYVFPIVLFIVAAMHVWKHYQRRHGSIAYGSARWAEPSDLPHMIEGHGLILGRMTGRVGTLRAVLALFNLRTPAREACHRFLTSFGPSSSTPVVRLTKAVHTAVFAPTGVGKGVSCVIPFLLTCPDSMVVIDFKGENAALTANARRKMGHRVVVLDPYKVTTNTPDTFNPLEHIDKDSPTALDDCRDLAEALVIRTGQEKEPHWNDSAEVWIAAMIALIVTIAQGEDKSLQSVRTLLTNPEKMQAAIAFMCQSSAMDGMLARLGHQLTHFKDKELASTLTTTNRFLRFLDTATIAESTKRSSFNPADLLTTKTTIYLILPPDRVRAQSALLRVWIGSMLRAVVKGGLQETNKVHFVLDEAASLGHMDAIDDAVDKYRGYGVRLLFLWQSLGQLRTCFPDGQDQTFLSNVTQVFFGVNDQQTAEYVSSRLGEATQTVESGGTSRSTSRQTQPTAHGDSSSTSSSTSQNWQYMARRLLKPEEVAALPERVAITFTPGVPPIATHLVRYYEKDFTHLLRGISPVRAAFKAAALFILTAALAVTFTAALFIPTVHERNPHVQADPHVHRTDQERPAAHTR